MHFIIISCEKMESIIEIGAKSKLIEINIEDGATKKCFFCHKSELNEVVFGKMYQLEEMVVHHFCLLFSSALPQNGKDDEGILGFMISDIQQELKRGKQLKCAYCKKKNATIGCSVKRCRRSFHFTCGVTQGRTLNQFVKEFPSYCENHKHQVTISGGASSSTNGPDTTVLCQICLQDVSAENEDDIMTPRCCNKAILHINCIKRYALASGYYCKCPCCNRTKEFIQHLALSGVYVPKSDSIWESEPGAYDELYKRDIKCDSNYCKCSEGPEYQGDNNQWEIIRCFSCGSSGIHYGCAGFINDNVDVGTRKWYCVTCEPIAKKPRLS